MSVPSGNLGEIRRAVFDSVDWSPSASQGAVDRTNRLINRAYMNLAEEVPYLFFQDRLVVATQPDYTSADATDLISATTDRWIMEHDVNGGPKTSWPVDRTWDGRWLEITDDAGVARRLQIRHFFANDPKPRFSLMDPIESPSGSNQNLTYRVYTPEYFLPDDVIAIQSVRLYDSGNTWPLTFATQDEAEEKYWDDTRSSIVSGLPRYAYRRRHYKMPDPNTAPVAAAHASNAWQSPEPPGTFYYVYTLCWGRRDQAVWGKGAPTLGSFPQQRPEPLWESGPSPASAVANTNSTGHKEITITVPNMEHMAGFGGTLGTNPLRFNKSGWYYRIYRKRATIATAHAGAEDNVEISNAYYFLDEHENPELTFTDDGSIVPDYTRRLREVHGYQGFALYPAPDQRYEMDIRCVRRPEILVDDVDAPRVHTDAVELLIQATLVLFYEHLGNLGMKREAELAYERRKKILAARYGSLHPAGQPGYRKPGRAKSRGARRALKRWY